MNAVIALCNFCEVHGPCPIFCTHTLRDTKLNSLTCPINGADSLCPGCSSIGRRVGMWTEDAESNANFLSTQTAIIADIVPLIKQAAVRSLSCEVSGNDDGNLVFFGDATYGHVLSYTFQIHDSQARGFFRLFSIVVLMKDKMYLLNLQPFLSEHLQQISTELQTYSSAIHSSEQAKYSERAQRLNSGQTSTRPPRSLIELTGESNVFAVIHSHFTWILWMGARYLTENISMVTTSLAAQSKSYSVIELPRSIEQPAKVKFVSNDMESGSFIRKCKHLLGEDFVAACYCVLVGYQVILKGSSTKATDCIKCFSVFLPASLHHLISIDLNEYFMPDKCRILSMAGECSTLPQPSQTIMLIDICDNMDRVKVQWLGQVPNRLPDLLTRILKAINEPLLTDQVLLQHIRVLVEEWKNKIFCYRTITSPQELPKMKHVLGIQSHDQLLLNYWIDLLAD